MRKMKVLLLGGTKFLGLELIKKLSADSNFETHIASRRDIGNANYHRIDRKSETDLIALFKSDSFDIVVDFISYSQPDATKLINAIHAGKHRPHLITISTTYVYGNPMHLDIGRTYQEESFNPIQYNYVELDRPEADYYEGKKSMESFIAKNYDNYLMPRFPIILGANDYTGRTTFFSDLIKRRETIHFDEHYGKSNFIFSLEAAGILYYFIQNPRRGIVNCVMEEALSQSDILALYCQYHGLPLEQVLGPDQKITKSPFYYKHDFLIDSTKLHQSFKLNSSFESALTRELNIMHSE